MVAGSFIGGGDSEARRGSKAIAASLTGMGKTKQAKRVANAEHEMVGKVARNRERRPVALLGKMSEVADQPPLVAISLVTIAAGAILRRGHVVRTGTRMLIAHALATGAKTILKTSIDRTRPAKALADGEHQAGAGSGASDTALNSFPSGHTAGAVSIAQAVAHTTPSLAIPIRVAAAAIAAIQLPKGKHYPSDVAAGAALGWAAERLSGVLITAGERTLGRMLDPRGEYTALAEAEAHPS